MKKIIGLSLVLMIVSVAASAQNVVRKHRAGQTCVRNQQITVGERAELRRDAIRVRLLQRRSQRDGIVTPIERRRVQKAKLEARRDLFRFKHNPRRRLI